MKKIIVLSICLFLAALAATAQTKIYQFPSVSLETMDGKSNDITQAIITLDGASLSIAYSWDEVLSNLKSVDGEHSCIKDKRTTQMYTDEIGRTFEMRFDRMNHRFEIVRTRGVQYSQEERNRDTLYRAYLLKLYCN